jgi:hypothetical protein
MDIFPPFSSHIHTCASGEVIYASPRAADDVASDSTPSPAAPAAPSDDISINISYTSTIHTVVAPLTCCVADVKIVLANHFGLPSPANLCLVYAGERSAHELPSRDALLCMPTIR